MPVHFRMRAFDRDLTAESIMASGPVRRANRPNKCCTDHTCDVKISLANPEPSTHGTSRVRRNASAEVKGRADVSRTSQNRRV